MTTAVLDDKPAESLEETQRQTERSRIKRLLAERQVRQQRLRLIDGQIRDQDGRTDAATAAHQTICQPAQARLAEIEESITQAIMQRKPVDRALESERIELLQTIADANEVLERETAAIQKVRSALEAERRPLIQSVAEGAALENQLARLASPELLCDKFVAKQAAEWAARRLNAARAQLSTWLGEIQKIDGHQREPEVTKIFNSGLTFTRPNRQQDAFDREQLKLLSTRVARWEAEVRASDLAVREANAEVARVHKEILDE